jgi:hypothetical protein
MAGLLHKASRNWIARLGWWLVVGQALAWLFFLLAASTPLALIFNSRVVIGSFVSGGIVGVTLYWWDRLGSASDEREFEPLQPPESAVAEMNRTAVEPGSFSGTSGLRFSLTTLLLGVCVLSLFLKGVFGLEGLSWDGQARVLVGLAVLCILGPVVMWWLPQRLRWSLWAVVYLCLFVGSQHGVENYLGIYTAICGGLGSLVGLIILRRQDRRELGQRAAANGRQKSLSWAVLGFMVGAMALTFSVPLMLNVTLPLRGPVVFVSEWATKSRAHDDQVNSLIGFVYVGLGLLSLRFWAGFRCVHWWKGFFFGIFVTASCVAVLAFCFH